MKHTPLSFEDRVAHAAQQPGLSAAERVEMRAALTAHMRQHPVLAAVPSPYQVFFHRTLYALSRPAPAFIAAFLILTLTLGGVAHAAENTLPGDTLYPVKVDVIEPAQLAFTASTDAKNKLHVAFAERRITEAATLAQQGKLDTNTEATLAANFSENAAAVSTSTAPSVTFAAQLAAYDNVLTNINTQKGSNPTLALQNAIHAQIAVRTTSNAFGITVATAHMLQDAADMALNDSAQVLAANTASITASSSAQAKNTYVEAQTFSLEGDTFLKHDDTEGASNAYKSVLSTTARLDVFTSAAAQFKIDAFSTTSTTSTTTATSSSSIMHRPNPTITSSSTATSSSSSLHTSSGSTTSSSMAVATTAATSTSVATTSTTITTTGNASTPVATSPVVSPPPISVPVRL
jgi:hypothetical protein